MFGGISCFFCSFSFLRTHTACCKYEATSCLIYLSTSITGIARRRPIASSLARPPLLARRRSLAAAAVALAAFGRRRRSPAVVRSFARRRSPAVARPPSLARRRSPAVARPPPLLLVLQEEKNRGPQFGTFQNSPGDGSFGRSLLAEFGVGVRSLDDKTLCRRVGRGWCGRAAGGK